MNAGSAAEIFGRGLAEAQRETPSVYRAIGEDGSDHRLPLRRWVRRPGSEERRLLALARGPVLDVGCGAGRHLSALRRLGVAGLGVDVAPAAVALARRGGSVVVERSIFAELPAAGRWATALLLDGNVGIGGDPLALLRRVAELVEAGGMALVEVEAPGRGTRKIRLRLEGGGSRSEWFPWAWVSADQIGDLARLAGWELESTWSDHGRWFARLDRPIGVARADGGEPLAFDAGQIELSAL